ncbi:MAG TPA: hypothetical protein VMA30_13705 [Xanthobacteraceae bacterium]|nr:hypothetical protein [Xanthobacteraceae bacterium]
MKLARGAALAVFCLTLQLSIMPTRAQDDHQDDHYACMGDAMTVCGRFIPDRERVARCLMANRNRVSPACRVALKHFK